MSDNRTFICCICSRTITGEWGNNPSPVNDSPDAICCDECNMNYVIPARIKELTNPVPLKHRLM